ncbi:MAG TPA: hypothetical protein VHB20_00795 [Verrucomicrobiae bacterium]|jgi:hypothetical protein|nr:hypothetical protein [Verrucomicrobiae bacterium]
MLSRIFFAAITLFWLAMNFFLWRSQWGGSAQAGTETPVKVVWQKILTAPDNSSMEIYDHDRKIGFCHWTVTSGEAAAANKSLQEDYAPGSDLPQVSAYALSLDGNVALAESNRIRFDARLTLATNQAWRDFRIRANVKPMIWDVQASAATRQLAVKLEQDGARWERNFTLAELENPQALLEELGGPAAALWAGAIGLAPGTNGLSGMLAGARWQAHEDHMQFGHSRVRVYRLEAQFLGRHVDVFVSLVGEILWVQLPNDLTVRNEAFDHF